MPALPFAARIERRYDLWWGRPRPGGRTVRDAVHRHGERRRLRDRDDADEAWRCCEAWPRTLLNKLNAREYAARHGCPLPSLHWSGADPDAAPLEALEGDFVVRPLTGFGRIGVLVVAGGRDVMRDEPAAPAEVRARWPRGRLGRARPALIEERIRPVVPGRTLPLELKLHTFGPLVGAIERIDRRDMREYGRRYYTRSWEPYADEMSNVPQDDPVPAPPDLAEIVAVAERIGASLGTYMRVDFFAAPDGPVFNEFSATPWGGGPITPMCDELFGGLWAEHCGDAV